MKEIKGDLILKENYSIDDNLIVHGNIICEGGFWNIKAKDINYYAVAFACNSFNCKSIKGSRKNSKHFCLDGEIKILEGVKNEYYRV